MRLFESLKLNSLPSSLVLLFLTITYFSTSIVAEVTIDVPAPPPDPCSSPCAFYALTTPCSINVCVCDIWASAGNDQTISKCVACIRPLNTTLAEQYTAQVQSCITALAAAGTTVTTTISIPAASVPSDAVSSTVETTVTKTAASSSTAVFTGGAVLQRAAVEMMGIAGLVAGIIL